MNGAPHVKTNLLNAHMPTLNMHLWPYRGLEYWLSAFEPIAKPLRTWHEPIEDEL